MSDTVEPKTKDEVLLRAIERVMRAQWQDQMNRQTEKSTEPCDHDSWECHASGALLGYADAIRVLQDLRRAG